MSKLLVSTVCAILALPVAALADNDRPVPYSQQSGWHAPSPNYGGEHHYDRDDHDRDRSHRSYGYSPTRYYASPVRYYAPPARYYASPVRHYAPPVRYYAPAPHYYYGGHHHDGDNDDALWAVGGLVLGAVIGHAIEHSSATAPSSTAARPAPTCKDIVAYDSDGNPYVKRDCN